MLPLLGLLLLSLYKASATSMFNFNITCTASSATCGNMTQTLLSAGQRLSNILNITNQVNVSVSLQSFGTSGASALGFAGPAAYGIGRIDTTRPYTYFPQALLKQIDMSTAYTGNDIVATFNSDFNFYFNSSGVAIIPSQYDFEYVACHELTHGLGFIDGLQTSFDSASTAPTFLIPGFASDTATGTTFNNWVAPLIFDTYMWDFTLQTNFYTYYKTIVTNYNTSGAPLATLDSAFTTTGVPFTAAQASLNASLSTTLKFNSAFNSTPVALYSPSTFAQGSSIAHTDYNTYTGTPDFLMLYTISDYVGVALDSILSSFNFMNNSVYGPSTFATMASIGWVTNINPNAVVTFHQYDSLLAGSGSVGAFCWPNSSCPISTTTSATVTSVSTSETVILVSTSTSTSMATLSIIVTSSAQNTLTSGSSVPSTTITPASTISSSAAALSTMSSVTNTLTSQTSMAYIANTTSGASTTSISTTNVAKTSVITGTLGTATNVNGTSLPAKAANASKTVHYFQTYLSKGYSRNTGYCWIALRFLFLKVKVK